MFRSRHSSGRGSHSFYNNLLSGQINDIEELQLRLRGYFQRRLEECENEIVPETNTNKNFLHEKDIKFKLYPFYINWKKIEKNESEYYLTLAQFGYFGVSVYSIFKEIYPGMKTNNMFFIFASFIFEYLNNPNKSKEDIQKEVKEFIEKLPELKKIYSLIKNKIIMFKEVPMYLMILKIYEIYMIYNNDKNINEHLKYEYMFIKYLTDEEYNQLFTEHFSGKVNHVFKNITRTFGKKFEFPISKEQFTNHLKYIYQSINNPNNNLDEEQKSIHVTNMNLNNSF